MLTRKEADRIMAVIQVDANACGALFRARGKACVIGGLYEAAFHSRGISGTYEAVSKVTAVYPLTQDECDALIWINDAHQRTPARRRALIKEVNSWVEEEVTS